MYGTDTGIFISDRKPRASNGPPKKVLDIKSVTQLDVLEEYQLLLVLADKALLSYSLEALEVPETQSSPLVRRPRKIQNHAAFFQTGVCVGRHLVCSAKASGMSTTIKVFEPLETQTRTNRKMGGLGTLFQGSQDTLKPFKVKEEIRQQSRNGANHIRNSISPPKNPPRSTSSRPNSVSRAPAVSKSSLSRPSKPSPCSTKPIPL